MALINCKEFEEMVALLKRRGYDTDKMAISSIVTMYKLETNTK